MIGRKPHARTVRWDIDTDDAGSSTAKQRLYDAKHQRPFVQPDDEQPLKWDAECSHRRRIELTDEIDKGRISISNGQHLCDVLEDICAAAGPGPPDHLGDAPTRHRSGRRSIDGGRIPDVGGMNNSARKALSQRRTKGLDRPGWNHVTVGRKGQAWGYGGHITDGTFR